MNSLSHGKIAATNQYQRPYQARQVTIEGKPVRIPATLPDGATGIETVMDGEPASLILLKRGDTVRAFHNVCPHAGRKLELAPGRFIVEDGYLICAAHGACFTIPDGECVAGPCRGQALVEVAVIRDS